MKKFGLLVLAVGLVLTGCQLMDSLFYGVDEVKSDDLKSFEGDAATSEDELINGTMAAAAEMSEMSDPMMSEELKGFFSEQTAKSFAAIPVQKAVRLSLAQEEITRATTEITESESINETYGPWTVAASYSVEGTADDTALTVDAAGEGELEVTQSEAAGSLRDSVVNAKGKFDVKASESSGDYDIDAKVSFASSLGASIDNVGKVIINFKYVGGINDTISEEDLPTIDEKLDLDLEINVAVYDNENNETYKKTYTEDDLMNIYSDMMGDMTVY